MEIGGYRELDLHTGNEFYASTNVARLNAGRCGIYHAACCFGAHKVLLPYYQCETVRDFLLKKGMEVSYYHIGLDMLPILDGIPADTAVVVVNYFGLIKQEQLCRFVQTHPNVIIDNTQGFYQPNIPGAYSVYSPRKFFGVPDGCYVIGAHAENHLGEYGQDISAPTANFLLARIESGGNANYALYQNSEARLAASDILRMSKLTHALLDNIDYETIREKRQKNYDYAVKVFASLNQLPESLVTREPEQVPMVYPLMIEQEDLRHHLKSHDIFVGQWWKYLLSVPQASAWEKNLSRYLLPIQIDQRYGVREIDYTASVIQNALR